MILQTPGHARPQYVNQVPTVYGCPTCHLDERNRQLRTGFAIDFALNRGIWADIENPAVGICGLDSDRDGLSNGAELNDPNCEWIPGQPRPNGETTNPADPRDPDRCGDGWLQTGEACDGQRFGGTTCDSLGFAGGQLRCSERCEVDTSACQPLAELDVGVDPDLDQGVEPIEDPGELDAGMSDMERDMRQADGTIDHMLVADAFQPNLNRPDAHNDSQPKDDASIRTGDATVPAQVQPDGQVMHPTTHVLDGSLSSSRR